VFRALLLVLLLAVGVAGCAAAPDTRALRGAPGPDPASPYHGPQGNGEISPYVGG
jgi:hypothetical protein